MDISPTTPYPALEQQVLAASGWFPSLSHSGGWLAVALGRERLGLDIEGLDLEGLGIEYLDIECLDSEGLNTARRRPRDWLAIANQCFAPEDQAALQAAPAAERTALGYRIWTLKEAAIKLGGGSLFGDLNRLRYHPGGQVALDRPDNTPRWAWSGQTAGLSLALCGLGPQPRRVRLYREAPGASPDLALQAVAPGQLQARFVPVL
ncbi:4'-phosphopantetheinyl transferase family protein [Parahaliea mediterranea]|uniref:4'-phosphopantetheinyl transferase family protein n=1 Tax=Parahaliea mediterranea TaxID=651086 RepID=UPI0013005E27|nr:4'-phosphopantetheinyl transferase superfamily protein [Parahaliea mediterranea]